MLKNIKGPIGVIAVAGMYRTGKSYLLNRMLLNRSKGFGVGPSINPCTKGLWVWGTPITGFTPEGNPINVLVIDSEGIGGLDEDNNHDMRIFSLAVLLSSYFLYNSTGSIDENALSSLSLVVNLTKHIQFKSTEQSNEEDNGEKLQQIMPSFMWVVRDFALQLVDEDQNEMSSKEYLEKALQERGNDSKNEIRKALKQFFQQRDCCTMIRPLTNEDELQNLESMEIEELRVEFIEQVMNLRRKVINQIKPKQVNGQSMDGQTWVELVEQYVNAINEGAFPDIHSSWQYICRQRAQQTLNQSLENFEIEVQDTIQIPSNHNELDSFLENLKNQIVDSFKKAVKGEQDIQDEYLKELEKEINNKIQVLQNNNQYECKRYAQDMLQQLFSEFDSQIKNSTSKVDCAQLEQSMKELNQFYESNCFDFSEKFLMLSEAKVVFLQDTLGFYQKQYQSEIEVQKQLEGQMKERLEVQLREAKEESRAEKIKIEDKYRQVMIEKSEIEASLQFLKEQYETLKTQKEQDEGEYIEQIKTLKDSLESQTEDHRTQKDEFEERLQKMQRHLMLNQSEFDKERALFDQKVEFLEKALQEKQAKEKDIQAEWQSKRSEMNDELKQMCSKYESDIKGLTTSLEELREKNTEIETILKEKQDLLEEKESSFQKMEVQYKKMLQQSQDQVKQMELSLSSIKKENEKVSSAQAKERDGRVEEYQNVLNEKESILKETIENLKSKENEFKKERAIKDQKIEFLEMQLQESREQLEEAYRQHESMVKAMKEQNSPDSKKDEVNTSKDQWQMDEMRLHQDYSEQIQSLKTQLENAQEKVQELELQIKLNEGDYQREIKEMRQQIFEVDGARGSLVDKIKQLEQSKVKLIEESGLKLKETIQRFEEDIEERENKAQEEIKEVQVKCEEALTQLRNFYEIEKEKLEARLQEEREKGQRRMHCYQDELEQRMREEMSEKEEEIACLHNEIREIEQRHQQYINQVEHELSLKENMIQTLERQVKEGKERIELMENGRNSAFEKQLDHFENQRQEYNQKIDKLQLDNIEKDRQLAQANHKIERLKDEVDRKKQELDILRATLDKEKKQLNEKLENTKKKLTEAQDEAMQKKLEFGREEALSKQQVKIWFQLFQIEFQNKKIEELSRQSEENQRYFDEKLKSYKQEVQEELAAYIQRLITDKELWENKYEQKRRALKEVESSLSKTNHELEMKISTLASQNERIEDEKKQLEENYQEEITSLQNQLQALDSSAGAAYYYGSTQAEDVMKLKGTVQELERELSDLQSTYDRDKALWEGKCQFLESQKETYKRDLLESQKKFEITLEQLQKRGSIDKDKYENNQNALIKVIEGKYKNQIKELIDTHQCLQNESQSKIKRLESELKYLNEKIQLDARGKLSEQGSLEKRVQEMAENEKRYQSELEDLKVERDRRIQDYSKQMEKDKENFKAKLSEYEQKAKESENRRAALMFEFEKERAKWQLERDNLMNQKSEMMEQIDRLGSKKDQLLRENEKLRNENKNSRKYLFTNTANQQLPPMGSSDAKQSSAQSSSATRYMVNKSVNQGTMGANILNHAITKMKENNKYIGGEEDYRNKNTTPNTKHNRYGNQ